MLKFLSKLRNGINCHLNFFYICDYISKYGCFICFLHEFEFPKEVGHLNKAWTHMRSNLPRGSVSRGRVPSLTLLQRSRSYLPCDHGSLHFFFLFFARPNSLTFFLSFPFIVPFRRKTKIKRNLKVVVLSSSVSRVRDLDPRECPKGRGNGGEVRHSVDPRSLQEPPRRFFRSRTRTRRCRPPRPPDPRQLAAVNSLAFAAKQQSFLGQSRSQLHRSRWRPIRLGLAALSLNALHSGPVFAVACFTRSFSFAIRFVIAIGMRICLYISC